MPDIFDTLKKEDIFDRVDTGPDVFDDLETSLLEATGQNLKEAFAAPVRGTETLIGGLGGLAEMGAESASIGNIITKHAPIPGIGWLAEHVVRKYGPKKALDFFDKRMSQYAEIGRRFQDFWTEQANKGWEAPNPEITEARWRDRPIGKGISAIGAGVPSVVAAVGASVATGSPHVGLGILASTETGNMYHQLREKDVPPNIAVPLAQLAGAWTYVTEKIPLDRLLKPANRSIQGMIKQAGYEGFQEVIETMGHNLLEYFGYDYRNPEDIPTAVKSAVDHVMDDTMSALVGGVGIGGMSHAVMARGQTQEQAQKIAKEIKNIPIRPPTMHEITNGDFINNTEDFIDFIDTTPARPDIIPMPQNIEDQLEGWSDLELQMEAQAEIFMKAGASIDDAWTWAQDMIKRKDISPAEKKLIPKAPPEVIRKKLLHVRKTRPIIKSTIRQEADKLIQEGLTEEQAVQLLNDIRKEGVTFDRITKPGEITEMLKEAQDRYEANEFEPGNIHDHETKEFSHPGWLAQLTPKWRVLRNIGAEYIILPIEARYMKMRLETIRFHNMVDKTIKILNKRATLGDRIVSRILKRNTAPVDRIVDMLDTYEWAPEWMSKKEAALFNQLRSYTKWLLNSANIERKKAGLPIINDFKSYIPHWRNNIADMIVNKNVPLQTGFIYRILKGLPKVIPNKTAMRRKIRTKLNEHYSRDLGALLKAVASYDLRDMYLTRPVQAARDELLALEAEGKISRAATNYITDWINYDILQHKTSFDEAFNVSVKLPVDLINKVLKPIGREIHDPAESLFGSLRELMHLGALGLRVRPVTRNLGQRGLLTSLFRFRDLLRAQFGRIPIVKHPETGENIRLTDLLKEQDWYQITKGLPEDVDITSEGFMNKLTRWSMAPFRLSHVGNRYLSNVEISVLTGYYDWLYRYNKSHDPNSRYYKHIQQYSKKHDIPIEELQTQKEDMMPDIRDAVRMTQWEYFSTSMPTIMRGQAGRFSTIYQSWWMNWWFNLGAEMTNRLVTGRTKKRGDGTGGRLLAPYARLRAAKGLSGIVGLARFAESVFGIIALSSLILPGPTGLPPGLAFIAGVLMAMTEKDEKRRKKHWKNAMRSLKLVMPFRNFMKDFARFMEGEYDLKDFIFYTDKKKK